MFERASFCTFTTLPLSHVTSLEHNYLRYLAPSPLLFAYCQPGDEISGITLPSVMFRPLLLFCLLKLTHRPSVTLGLVILKCLISAELIRALSLIQSVFVE